MQAHKQLPHQAVRAEPSAWRGRTSSTSASDAVYEHGQRARAPAVQLPALLGPDAAIALTMYTVLVLPFRAAFFWDYYRLVPSLLSDAVSLTGTSVLRGERHPVLPVQGPRGASHRHRA